MKKFFGLFFIFILIAGVIAFVGCDSDNDTTETPNVTTTAGTTGGGTTEAATTDPSVTTTANITEASTTSVSTTAATTAPSAPSTPTRVAIGVSGKSNYTVVYDGSDKKLESAVKTFATDVKTKYGFTMQVKSASSLSEVSDLEIVIGSARESGKELQKKLKWENDFAVSANGNTVNLCATNEVSYNYLFEYLLCEGLVKSNGNVYVEVGEGFLYSSSSLASVSYPEFHRKYNKSCEKEFMLKCFEDGTFKGTNGLGMKYRLYVPSNYDPNKDYPVLLFLHGAGHRGTDNAAPVKGIIYNLFNHKDPLVDDAIVLVPQCPKNYQWVDTPWAKGSYSVDAIPESKAMKTVLELLDMVEREYSTDKDRYYAFGLSMGGFGTWDLIMRHPDRFAAAVALCGGADPTKGSVLVDMPIWTVHSLDDTSVPVKGTQDMVKAIVDAGGSKIIYDELNGYGHGVGTITAVRDEVFKWMFAQSK